MNGASYYMRRLGRSISFIPKLTGVTGSTTATLLLSQLLYWSDKPSDPDGWVYKTQRELQDETGLTRTEQESARKRLVALGVLQEARRGIPARMHFRIHEPTLDAAIDALLDSQTRLQDSRNLERGTAANQIAGFPQSNSEITPEITQGVDPARFSLEEKLFAAAFPKKVKARPPRA